MAAEVSRATLIELIVTVAILAILASAAIPLANFRVKRAKDGTAL